MWEVYNGNVQGDVYDYSGYQYLRITIKGGISIVIASVGIYGKVEYRNYFTPPVHGELCGEIGLYVEIFWVWEGRVQFWKGCLQWPDSIDEPSIEDIMKIISPQTGIGFSNGEWQPIQREYGEPVWQNNEIGVLIKEVFPNADPIINSRNGKKMMVWGYDDQTKPPIDGLEIKYSIWNGDSWITPKFVTQDNFCEIYPSVTYLENGDAICVYNVIPEENVNDFNDFIEKIEVAYSYWDYESDEWTLMNLIGATDEFMDMQPVIASDGNQAVVVWTCNDDKNIFAVNDKVAYASFWDGNEWFNTRKIIEGNIVSQPLSIVFKDGEASVAYEIDEDGNLSTVNDKEIYVKTFSSTDDISTVRITDDDHSDVRPSMAYLGNTLAITWVKEKGNLTELFYQEIDSGNPIKIMEGNISHPTLLPGGSDGEQPLIGWKDHDLEKIFITRNEDGNWITEKIYNSTRFIDQFCWDYTDSMPYASFVEKDNITSMTDCDLVHRTFNNEPDKPNKLNGPTDGKPGEEYTYTSSATDIEKDEIYYMFDWGDDSNMTWLGPYESGEIVEASHTWAEQGTYELRVKAMDTQGDESYWSDPLSVIMPRNRIVNRPILNFLEQHPILYQLLQRFLRL